jgi:hypothetical protein
VNAVHLALTPLAGAPIRIVDALNRHGKYRARLIDANPRAYGGRVFKEDLCWGEHQDACREVLAAADILHLHHYFDVERSVFGNLRQLAPGARLIRHFHSASRFISKATGIAESQIVGDPLPQLVIPHYPERDFPFARVVPNPIPEWDEAYCPLDVSASPPIVFFSPTAACSFKDARWDTKGKPEVLRMLESLARRGSIRIDLVEGLPFAEAMRRKRLSDIVIDDVVTGSFHLTSLESLAQGKPTLAYLDPRSIASISELTGSARLPWVNVRLDDCAAVIAALAADPALRREIGGESRRWIERYYGERQTIEHFVAAYDELIEHGTLRRESRLGIAQQWLAKPLNDLRWGNCVARYDRHFGNPGLANTAMGIWDLSVRATRYNGGRALRLAGRVLGRVGALARVIADSIDRRRRPRDP